jgi:tetratricopeptide (TPR) repeat protein
LSGESRLRLGDDPKLIQQELERAFALSCQLGDPCWEAAVARTIGLCREACGDFEHALAWFTEARRRCVRETDTYVALLVEILADQARLSATLGRASQANACLREGLSLAARAHMDAHVHRVIQLMS